MLLLVLARNGCYTFNNAFVKRVRYVRLVNTLSLKQSGVSGSLESLRKGVPGKPDDLELLTSIPGKPDDLELLTSIPGHADKLKRLLDGNERNQHMREFAESKLKGLCDIGESNKNMREFAEHTLGYNDDNLVTNTKDYMIAMKKYAEETLKYPDQDMESCLVLLNQGYFKILHGLTNFKQETYLKYNGDAVGLICSNPKLDGIEYSLAIKTDVLEYISDPRNDVIYRLLDSYTRETCPVFVLEDLSKSSEMIGEGVIIAARELPSNLSYVPGLVAGIVTALLAILISAGLVSYINSKTSNKNVYVFRLITLLYALLLILFSFINSLLKLMGIDSLDKFILNRIKTVFSKLQDNKQDLVSNLGYILEKIKETSTSDDYKISNNQANELSHDTEFKKRLDTLKSNIRAVKLLTLSLKVYKYYFMIPSINIHSSVWFFEQYLQSVKPLKYDDHVKTGLDKFRELYNDFNNPKISKHDSMSVTLLDTGGFLRERCYKNFMECFNN